jgi:hypothetical protein
VRLAVFVLTLLVGAAALAQSEGSARQALDACIEQIPPEAEGLEDLEVACPGIETALEDLGVMPLLSETQHGVLNRTGLVNLRSLLERYEQPPERTAVGVDSLHPVLESLREPPKAERPLSWYERFKRWLRTTFDKDESGGTPWLRRWLDEYQMSETVRLVLFYGVMALVVLLAIFIVVNEVRAARAGKRKSMFAKAKSAVGAKPGSALDDFDLAAHAGQPSLVLRMLIATLVETGRLQGDRSLTHTELTKRARFDDSAQRECFQSVVRVAERAVYSGHEIAKQELEDAVRSGRTLHAQLSGAAT